MFKICIICGKEFETKTRAKVCSSECSLNRYEDNLTGFDLVSEISDCRYGYRLAKGYYPDSLED